jgi:hypothetical protein
MSSSSSPFEYVDDVGEAEEGPAALPSALLRLLDRLSEFSDENLSCVRATAGPVGCGVFELSAEFEVAAGRLSRTVTELVFESGAGEGSHVLRMDVAVVVAEQGPGLLRAVPSSARLCLVEAPRLFRLAHRASNVGLLVEQSLLGCEAVTEQVIVSALDPVLDFAARCFQCGKVSGWPAQRRLGGRFATVGCCGADVCAAGFCGAPWALPVVAQARADPAAAALLLATTVIAAEDDEKLEGLPPGITGVDLADPEQVARLPHRELCRVERSVTSMTRPVALLAAEEARFLNLPPQADCLVFLIGERSGAEDREVFELQRAASSDDPGAARFMWHTAPDAEWSSILRDGPTPRFPLDNHFDFDDQGADHGSPRLAQGRFFSMLAKRQWAGLFEAVVTVQDPYRSDGFLINDPSRVRQRFLVLYKCAPGGPRFHWSLPENQAFTTIYEQLCQQKFS